MNINQFLEKIDNEYDRYVKYYSLYDKEVIIKMHCYTITKIRSIYDALYFFIDSIEKDTYWLKQPINQAIDILRKIQEFLNVDSNYNIINDISEYEAEYDKPMFFTYDKVAQIIVDNEFEILDRVKQVANNNTKY